MHSCVPPCASTTPFEKKKKVERILSSPEEAQKLKQEQLASLNAIVSRPLGGGGGHYGPDGGLGTPRSHPGLGFSGFSSGGDEESTSVDVRPILCLFSMRLFFFFFTLWI